MIPWFIPPNLLDENYVEATYLNNLCTEKLQET